MKRQKLETVLSCSMQIGKHVICKETVNEQQYTQQNLGLKHQKVISKKHTLTFSCPSFPTTICIGTVCTGTTAKPKQAKMYHLHYEILD